MRISRPEPAPLKEAERASLELKDLGICNQILIINGILEQADSKDQIAIDYYNRQKEALGSMPAGVRDLPLFYVPLRTYNIKVKLKLQRKKTYYVRVRYVGKGGYCKWSKVRRVETK